MKKQRNLLIQGVFYNLLGSILPFAIGLITIPYIVNKMGIDQYGLLNLTWVVIGYFSFLDLGLGRTLVKTVAEKLSSTDSNDPEISKAFWFMTIIMFSASLFVGIIFWMTSEYLVQSWFQIPEALKTEAINCFKLLSLSLFIVPLLSLFRGAIEAQKKFGWINVIHAFMMSATYVLPAVAVFTNGILFSAGVIFESLLLVMIVRLVVLFVYFFMARRSLPVIKIFSWPERSLQKKYFFHGGWLLLSQILSPLLVYVDRLFLGRWLPVGYLAYYNTPLEMITRVLVLPGAVSRVLFPSFASQAEEKEFSFRHGFKYLLIALFPLCSAMIFFSELGLDLWLGKEFSSNSFLILQIFILGMFLNGLAFVPFTFVQSSNHPQWLTYIYLIELPIYLVCLYFGVHFFGAPGAAAAWVLRMILDFVLLNQAVQKIDSNFALIVKDMIFQVLVFFGGLLLTLLVSFIFKLSLTGFGLWFLVLLLAHFFFWHKVFDSSEKDFLFTRAKRLLGR